MKRLLAILFEMAAPLTVMLAVPCCILCFHIGVIVKKNRVAQELTTLQSHLDHERSMNWLLVRRVGEREKGK